MIGLLVTNKYMQSAKFNVLRNGFIKAANNLNVKIDYKNNFDAYELLNEPIKYEFVIFYDKDIKLARCLEKKGYRLFNNSDVIMTCDDKYLTYMSLENKVKQPKTIQSPFLYFGNLSEDNEFIKKCEDNFTYPMIVKECCGSFGMQVYKIDNRNELIDCIKKIGARPFIAQEFIESSYGKDIRIQVVGDKVVAAMKRINENGDFRANVTNGATPYSYEPSVEEKDMAIAAVKNIGADFAGVDLLIGKNNEPLLCEINSNAHLEIIGNISNKNVYSEVIKYIIEKVR